MIIPIETGSCSTPRRNSPRFSNGCEKKWINGPRQREKKKSGGWKNRSSSARAMNGCFGRWRGMRRSGRCEEREGQGWEALCARSHRAPFAALGFASAWRRKLATPLAAQRCGFKHSSPPPQAVALAQQELSPNGALITLRDPPSPGPKTGHRPIGEEKGGKK